jgi:hypothetical protein
MKQLKGDEIREWVKSHRYAVIHIDAEWDRYGDEVQKQMKMAAEDFSGEVALGYVDADTEGDYAREIELGNVPTVAYYRDGELVARVVGASRYLSENIRVLKAGGVPGKYEGGGDLISQQGRSLKYVIAFLLFAVLLSGYAIQNGGAWHGLHWLAVNCVLLALGYAGVGAGIFMKRADGVIAKDAKFFWWPMLLYTWGLWWLCVKMSRESAYDAVNEGLVIGRRLTAGEAGVMREVTEGVDHWVDLTAEFEDPAAVRESEGYMCLPILDASVPDAGELRAMARSVKEGRVYVHCAQGHGRTGVFALALLAERGEIGSYDEGVEMLKEVRPGVGLNQKQEAFMRAYLEGVVGE